MVHVGDRRGAKGAEKPSESLTLGTLQRFDEGFLSNTREPNWRGEGEYREDNCFIEEACVEDTETSDGIGKDAESGNCG